MDEDARVVVDGRARVAQRVVEDARADRSDRGGDARTVADEVGPLVAARVHRPATRDGTDVPVATLRSELSIEDPAVIVGSRHENGGAGISERVAGETEAE